MGKLTKEQAKLHQEAAQLVTLARDLTEDEREFVLTHWQESASTRNVLDGAFFTPLGLAREMQIDVSGRRIIDLCAGIGRLAWAARDTDWERVNGMPPRELVCVERNPDYVAVGRKVLPEARWICADVLDVPGLGLGEFDCAISNPPFGPLARSGNAPGYTGRRFEYHVMAVAAQVARYGAFIVPQQSAPFRYSGVPQSRHERDEECQQFEAQTGIEMHFNVGIDTADWDGDWHQVKPRVEIVIAHFPEVRQVPAAAQLVGAPAAVEAPLVAEPAPVRVPVQADALEAEQQPALF
jgi:hypothetical protein